MQRRQLFKAAVTTGIANLGAVASAEALDALYAETDGSQDFEVVFARIRPRDLERLDRAAERRAVDREEVVAEAIDAFLAREMWSGGFIAPPPPMEVPGPYPWKPGAFRLRRRR